MTKYHYKMSMQETIFTKILMGIAISIAVLIIGGLYSFHIMTVRFESTYAEKIVSIQAEQSQINKNLKSEHNQDISALRETLFEIKVAQRDMIKTQTEILRELR